jgi:hypothetical protein
MISRHITAAACIPAYKGNLAPELRQALGTGMPKPLLRRMSDSDLLMATVLGQMQPGTHDALVSLSTYAQPRTVEEFIDSFPSPSPLRFQKSVHPASVQQHCVALQKPLASFIPLAGLGLSVIHAIRTALCRPEDVVILAGAEETGTWTLPLGACSETGFAFALKLCLSVGDGQVSLGSVEWDTKVDANEGLSTSAALHAAIERRSEYRTGHPDSGQVIVRWK